MRDVYASRLPLVDTGMEAFERAFALVQAHVRRELGLEEVAFRAVEGSLPQAPGVSLRWGLLAAPGVADRLWTLRVQRPHEYDTGLAWHLKVDVALEADRCWVGIRTALSPLGHRVAPVRVDIRPPALVGAAVDGLEVAEDGWPLSREPAYAVDDEGVEALAHLLLDPARVLPVVVITPVERYDDDTDTYRTEPVVDAERIADTLAGLAHVTVVETTELTYHLTGLVGRELAVFGGAVRLYWPEMDQEERPGNHPLWVPDRLAEPRNQPFDALLLRRIASTATFRVSAAALDARLRTAIEGHHRSEIAALFARAKEASLAPEWQSELERAWAELDRLRADYAEVVDQLAVAHENLRAIARHTEPTVMTDDLVDAGDTTTAIRSVVQAVEQAAAECRHLVILDEARDSAHRAAYRQPARVYRALLAMDEVAGEWSAGSLPTGFRDAFAEHGFAFASDVSALSLGRYPHEYQRTYDGRTIALGPHLAIGRGSPVACCRIYFYLDEERHLFVVGHVGNHLSDSTSG